jgi:hypothetical protein
MGLGFEVSLACLFVSPDPAVSAIPSNATVGLIDAEVGRLGSGTESSISTLWVDVWGIRER